MPLDHSQPLKSTRSTAAGGSYYIYIADCSTRKKTSIWINHELLSTAVPCCLPWNSAKYWPCTSIYGTRTYRGRTVLVRPYPATEY